MEKPRLYYDHENRKIIEIRRLPGILKLTGSFYLWAALVQILLDLSLAIAIATPLSLSGNSLSRDSIRVLSGVRTLTSIPITIVLMRQRMHKKAKDRYEKEFS